jgi:hypothetical protein
MKNEITTVGNWEDWISEETIFISGRNPFISVGVERFEFSKGLSLIK